MTEKYIYLICIIGFVLLLNISLIASYKNVKSNTKILGNIIQIAKNPWQKDQEKLKDLAEKIKELED